jgi:hypothetical protein
MSAMTTLCPDAFLSPLAIDEAVVGALGRLKSRDSCTQLPVTNHACSARRRCLARWWPPEAPLGQVGESQMTCPKVVSAIVEALRSAGATEETIAAAVNEFGAFEDAPKRQGGRP